MTLPPYHRPPLEWREYKSPSGRMTSYRLFAGSCHVATVAKDGRLFEAALRQHGTTPGSYGGMKFISKHRSLDKAKAAAEAAAQAEWKRFYTSMYTPAP